MKLQGGYEPMKISHNDLQHIEEEHHVITIQSDFPEIVYVIDRRNNEMWLINRQTGAQLEIDGGNVYKLTDEMQSVAEVYLQGQGLRKVV
jgi:hypothetical protein